MNAIGLLIEKGIYIVLAIPPIFQIIKSFFATRKDFKKIFLYSLPLISWTLFQYYGYLQEGKRFAGNFNLANYPNCIKCKLILEQDRTYHVISQDGVIMEKGKWNYKHYGDMSILEIGENGQFDYGIYTLGNPRHH